MLGPNLTLALFIAFACAGGLMMIYRRKPHLAVGVAMVASLLAPTWIKFEFGPLVLDTRILSGAILLAAYCLHPQGKLRFPIHWLDLVVAGIVLVHLASEIRVGNFGLTTLLRVFGEWSVPYLSGRCLCLYRGGVTSMAPWFAVTTVILAAGAIGESATGINLWELAFCEVDSLVDRSYEQRYELLYRASGPTRHPIFLAVVFLTLIPWAVVLIERGESVKWRFVGVLAVLSVILGILATASRGPLIALLIAGLTASVLRWPVIRKPAALVVGVGIVCLTLFWQPILRMVELTDSRPGSGELVVVGQDAEVYTGTRNRLLVWQIYAPLVVRGGPLGFGTEAVSSFPPNIPGLPAVARSAETLGIVDNSYLLIGLRLGWIGAGLFLLAIVGSIATAISLRRSSSIFAYPFGSAFMTALASTLVAVSVEIATVFSSYEHIFWLIFCCGLVAGTGSLRQRVLSDSDFDEASESIS